MHNIIFTLLAINVQKNIKQNVVIHFTFCNILCIVWSRLLTHIFIGFLIFACLFPIHRDGMFRLQSEILTLTDSFHHFCTTSLKKCLSNAVQTKSVKRSSFKTSFYLDFVSIPLCQSQTETIVFKSSLEYMTTFKWL